MKASQPSATTEIDGRRRASMMAPIQSHSSNSSRPLSCPLSPHSSVSPARPKRMARKQQIDPIALSQNLHTLPSSDVDMMSVSVGREFDANLLYDEIPAKTDFVAARDGNNVSGSPPRKGRSPLTCDGSEYGDDNNDLSSTFSTIFPSEKSTRTLGTTQQSIGTNIHVICRMRPFRSSSFMSSSTSSMYPVIHSVGSRSSISQMFVGKEEVDDDDSDDDDDDECSDYNKACDDNKLYKIRGNGVDCYDEWGNQRGSFEFTKIFNERASQKNVFANPEIRDILESLFLGFNGTIFTYGQTNAGKTYTMEGKSLSNKKTRGLIPRSISYIFETIATINKQLLQNKVVRSAPTSPRGYSTNNKGNESNSNNNNGDQNIEFTVSVSYYEIYCEKIRDILNPIQDNMKLRETKSDGFVVQDLTEITCRNEQEMLQILEKGKHNRATAATLMNAFSSRSHSIFCITIRQKVTIESKPSKSENLSDFHTVSERSSFTESSIVVNTVVRKSRLFLVDLAGSEKVSQTGAEGTRLEEAKNINSSLVTLGMVIKALSDGLTHVPFRDSRLTRLLMDSLGGTSKTLLVICCTADHRHSSETMSTLRFGERARKVTNQARVNEVEQQLSLTDMRRLLVMAKTEIQQLKLENALLRKTSLSLNGYAVKDGRGGPEGGSGDDDEGVYDRVVGGEGEGGGGVEVGGGGSALPAVEAAAGGAVITGACTDIAAEGMLADRINRSTDSSECHSNLSTNNEDSLRLEILHLRLENMALRTGTGSRFCLGENDELRDDEEIRYDDMTLETLISQRIRHNTLEGVGTNNGEYRSSGQKGRQRLSPNDEPFRASSHSQNRVTSPSRSKTGSEIKDLFMSHDFGSTRNSARGSARGSAKVSPRGSERTLSVENLGGIELRIGSKSSKGSMDGINSAEGVESDVKVGVTYGVGVDVNSGSTEECSGVDGSTLTEIQAASVGRGNNGEGRGHTIGSVRSGSNEEGDTRDGDTITITRSKGSEEENKNSPYLDGDDARRSRKVDSLRSQEDESSESEHYKRADGGHLDDDYTTNDGDKYVSSSSSDNTNVNSEGPANGRRSAKINKIRKISDKNESSTDVKTGGEIGSVPISVFLSAKEQVAADYANSANSSCEGTPRDAEKSSAHTHSAHTHSEGSAAEECGSHSNFLLGVEYDGEERGGGEGEGEESGDFDTLRRKSDYEIIRSKLEDGDNDSISEEEEKEFQEREKERKFEEGELAKSQEKIEAEGIFDRFYSTFMFPFMALASATGVTDTPAPHTESDPVNGTQGTPRKGNNNDNNEEHDNNESEGDDRNNNNNNNNNINTYNNDNNNMKDSAVSSVTDMDIPMSPFAPSPAHTNSNKLGINTSTSSTPSNSSDPAPSPLTLTSAFAPNPQSRPPPSPQLRLPQPLGLQSLSLSLSLSISPREDDCALHLSSASSPAPSPSHPGTLLIPRSPLSTIPSSSNLYPSPLVSSRTTPVARATHGSFATIPSTDSHASHGMDTTHKLTRTRTRPPGFKPLSFKRGLKKKPNTLEEEKRLKEELGDIFGEDKSDNFMDTVSSVYRPFSKSNVLDYEAEKSSVSVDDDVEDFIGLPTDTVESDDVDTIGEDSRSIDTFYTDSNSLPVGYYDATLRQFCRVTPKYEISVKKLKKKDILDLNRI